MRQVQKEKKKKGGYPSSPEPPPTDRPTDRHAVCTPYAVPYTYTLNTHTQSSKLLGLYVAGVNCVAGVLIVPIHAPFPGCVKKKSTTYIYIYIYVEAVANKTCTATISKMYFNAYTRCARFFAPKDDGAPPPALKRSYCPKYQYCTRLTCVCVEIPENSEHVCQRYDIQ